MRRRTFIGLSLLPVVSCSRLCRAIGGPAIVAAQSRTFEEALAATLNRFHRRYDVYSDAAAAGNHFAAMARLYSSDDRAAAERAVPPMNEMFGFPGRPGTCIRASFRSGRNDWGGWYFLNGTLGQESAPSANFGVVPNAGVDLTGATRLSFMAAGARGGERVEFFALGVGRDVDTGQALQSYPDSSPKVSTGYVTLSTSWRTFTIDLRGGRDLSYALGGFGWVASADRNRGQEIVFYIDDIFYDLARPAEPRFPLSFETAGTDSDVDQALRDFDRVLSNVAFTYDAAAALIALIAVGDVANAQLIADALVAAQQHDRFYTDGRLRNAYQAGDLFLPPGWTPNGNARTVRMPGWNGVDSRDGKLKWLEDIFQVSTHTGNVAWAMLGLLAFFEATERILAPAVRQRYLDAGVALGNWVEDNCRHARAGYTGGFNGWEPLPKKIDYRATEHNIDLMASFERLNRATQEPRWLDRAEHARRFVVELMWDKVEGKFWAGTDGASDDANRSAVPVDVQAWSVLALGERGEPYWSALDFAERAVWAKQGGGFAFSTADPSGTWYEGTAQMAAAYRVAGQAQKAATLVNVLRGAKLGSGAVPAASKDNLDTGFESVPGQKWLYHRKAHTGATAWAVLAERGVNPFAPMPALPAR